GKVAEHLAEVIVVAEGEERQADDVAQDADAADLAFVLAVLDLIHLALREARRLDHVAERGQRDGPREALDLERAADGRRRWRGVPDLALDWPLRGVLH